MFSSKDPGFVTCSERDNAKVKKTKFYLLRKGASINDILQRPSPVRISGTGLSAEQQWY